MAAIPVPRLNKMNSGRERMKTWLAAIGLSLLGAGAGFGSAQAQAPDWPGYFGVPRRATAAMGARVWKSYSDAAVAMALRILDGDDYTKEPRYAEVILSEVQSLGGMAGIVALDEPTAQRQAEWLKKKGLQ